MALPYPLASMPRNARRSSTSRRLFLVLLIAAFSTSFLVVGANFGFKASNTMPKEDPYKVLGIKDKDKYNLNVIKKAYREKARDAHPDKNPDVDKDVANARFHRIVTAWEFLSDKAQKKNYDNRKRSGWQQSQSWTRKQEQQRRKQNAANSRRQKEEQKRKDKEEADRIKIVRKLAREAQDNIQKIKTLNDLTEANIVDIDGRFTKHFLCVFVSNKIIENVAENEYYFPYPFGPKGRNDIDWGPLIGTAKVRFNKETPLTKAFSVPELIIAPYIVFVEKGTSLEKIQQSRRGKGLFSVFYKGGNKQSIKQFEKWVMGNLKTTARVVNRNPEGGPSIKVYFEPDGSIGRLQSAGGLIAPGFQLEIPVKLSDRLIIVDASTNEFIGSNGLFRQNSLKLDQDVMDLIAMDIIVVNEESQTINIGTGHGTTRTCYDLSPGCTSWLLNSKGSKDDTCQNQYSFAHSMCAKSCGVCIESPNFNGLYYTLMHLPLHRVPKSVRSVIPSLREGGKFLVMAGTDLFHIWSVRRNVMVGFLVAGLLFGIQIVLLARMMTGPSTSVTTKNTPSILLVGFLFFSTGVVALLFLWVHKAPTQIIPNELMQLRLMMMHSAEVMPQFVCLGVGSLVLCKVLTRKLLFKRPGVNLYDRAIYLALTVAVSYLMVMGVTLYFESEKSKGGAQASLNFRWNQARKNRWKVCVALIAVGQLLGITFVTMARFVIHKMLSFIKLKHLLISCVNFGVGCGLLSFALMDPHFLKDLDHVTSMRMSAAIPCFVFGIMMGMTGTHRLATITTKATMTTKTMKSQHQQHPQEIKEKLD